MWFTQVNNNCTFYVLQLQSLLWQMYTLCTTAQCSLKWERTDQKTFCFGQRHFCHCHTREIIRPETSVWAMHSHVFCILAVNLLLLLLFNRTQGTTVKPDNFGVAPPIWNVSLKVYLQTNSSVLSPCTMLETTWHIRSPTYLHTKEKLSDRLAAAAAAADAIFPV